MVDFGISRLLMAASIPNGEQGPANVVNSGFGGADREIIAGLNAAGFAVRLKSAREHG
jgi:hypothetical protein